MAFIQIVESSELLPEFSLRASDYINKGNNVNAAQQRLETGKTIPEEVVHDLVSTTTKENPPVGEGQFWEAADGRRRHSATHESGVRKVLVVHVGETHATVENTRTGHRTQVRLKAFRGTTKKDYRFVSHGS